jgi:hypothetical protein
MSSARAQPEKLDERDPWLTHLYGGKPIAPRVVGEEEDFARIGLQNFLLEPLAWFSAGYVLQGGPWRSVQDILGYWMILFVMLPLRLMDSHRPRDRRFRLQYVALQLLTLAAGYLGWRASGGN